MLSRGPSLAVKRTLNRVGSLVGHSYGGATITGSGTDERVVGLVYIAAVAHPLCARLQSISATELSADKVAWRSKPSWYILATQDHTVHPDLQRWVSKRMGATVTEVASSHVPMLSQPDVVIDVS